MTTHAGVPAERATRSLREMVHSKPALYALVAVLVLGRSAVFVFWEQSFFNANQAVFGLMAKHIAENRAWPVFMYGQNYMLAVEAWLAAPVFLIAGPSVAALKLPLLAMNLVIALLLVWMLREQARLSPTFTAFATVFFVIPPPGTAAQLLEVNGGNIEPLLYVLLLWLTRARPVWCGLVLGVGFLNRPFTVYGLLSLWILEAARGALLTRAGARRTAALVGAASAVWVAVQWVNRFAPALGPGTRLSDLHGTGTDVTEIARRICFAWETIPTGFLHLASIHWPLLFGTDVEPLRRYGIESGTWQGTPGASIVLGGAMALAAARIVHHLAREKRWRREFDPCAYLALVGALSASGYVVTRCGYMTLDKMNYELLSLLGAVGVAAWYLTIERRAALRSVWIGLVVAWSAVGVASHARLWMEYLSHAPEGGKQAIARELEARGVRYGLADYWTAYAVTFLTDERVIMSSTNRVRIRLYQRQVAEHRAEAVRVSRRPCGTAPPVMPHVYFCQQ
jgi:hypothetical protein